jgi:hypothetical protein
MKATVARIGVSAMHLTLRWIAPKGDEQPFSPIAQVVPRLEFRGEDGITALTPHCMTRRELDESIDGLIADLESARADGHRRFREFRPI